MSGTIINVVSSKVQYRTFEVREFDTLLGYTEKTIILNLHRRTSVDRSFN